MSGAIESGLDRLVHLAGDRGWRGFPTLAGESDVWVTGFVLAHVAPLAPRRRAVSVGRAAIVDARHAGAGWAYGGDVPPDADSTAWCLSALRGARSLGAGDRREARAFLERHRRNDGFVTFLPDSGIDAYIDAAGHSIEGWSAAHTEVSAAALIARVPEVGSLEAESLLSDLAARQTPAGVWNSYWWRGPHYGTALILRAVECHKRRLPDEAGKRALQALEREQLADGGFGLGAETRMDAFTTALALESLVRLSRYGGAKTRTATGTALLDAQRPDGAWGGDLIMRIPAPHITDPTTIFAWSHGGGGGNSFVGDRDGVFATALACHSLALWRAAEEGARADVDAWPHLTLPPKGEEDVLEVAVV